MTYHTVNRSSQAIALVLAIGWVALLGAPVQAQPAGAAQPSPAPAAQPAPPAQGQRPAPPALNPAVIPGPRPAGAVIKPATSETMTKPASVAQPAVALSPTPTFKPGEEPKVVFEKTDLDLGAVAEGEKVKFKFPFKNEGKSPLEILEVRKSCGCTRAETTKNVVKPGEGADIEGELDTQGRSGKQVKTITVRTNDPAHNEITLKFDINIKQEIGVNPSTLSFGSIDLDTSGTKEVTVTNFTDKPVKVLGFAATPEGRVRVRLISPLAEGNPNESRPVTGEKDPIRLEVAVAPSHEMGYFNGMVTIKTDSKAKPAIQLPVNGRVSGDLELFPPSIYFGLLKDTQPTTRTFTLSSRAGIPFKIAKIDQGALPVSIESEPLEGKEGYRFKIGLNPETLKQPSVNGKLIIETTHPKVNKVEINVAAYIRNK